MFEKINWRFYINASTKDKAITVLKRVEQVIGQTEVGSFTPYWKDKTLFEVECTTSFQIEEPEKTVYNVLLLVNQLGHSIDITGPLIFE
ncbi:hypothetical protein [Bacillus alkalicellulosilyticus]|uniref:hypothetical protein n=1 Tax=Alkalihalobacterium alkalicellulosilyticum TaxID=1912214 RepID=UPI0009968A71|nr:hypothetical protein [Bacillus alkalicellulosilyticus]